jgi:hypothetical protein
MLYGVHLAINMVHLGVEAAITIPMGFATNSMNMPSLVGKVRFTCIRNSLKMTKYFFSMYFRAVVIIWQSPLSTIFQLVSYIVVVSFIGGGNRIPGENHRPFSQVTDKLYHICCMEYTLP